MLPKFRFPEFPELMQDETFVIETKLTRDEAIARLQGQIKMPLFNFKILKPSGGDDFAGELTSDGFTVVSYMEWNYNRFSDFHPPLISGTWSGDNPVSIEGRISFAKTHITAIMWVRCFEIIFSLLLVFVPQFALLTASLDGKTGFALEPGFFESLLSYIGYAAVVLGMSLAVCFAICARFSRNMIMNMNHSFQRARKIFFEFFEVESPDP